jgi:hypothetical protein
MKSIASRNLGTTLTLAFVAMSAATLVVSGKDRGWDCRSPNYILAEDHGGEMNVQPGDGGGTCFVIRLPKQGKG